jgi:hypothetical protein
MGMLSLLLSRLAGAQDYQWTEIVIPGATVDSVWGINDRGQVAVTTTDGSGIYRHGTFTPLPLPPQGLQVEALGINNYGVITGPATTVDGLERGFILHGSTYTLFTRRGWDNTEPRAIANSGLITGWSFSADRSRRAGFIYDPDTDNFTDATPPGATGALTQGMNRFGRITGVGSEPGISEYGYVWQQGTIIDGKRELLPFLDRLKIDFRTQPRGINDSGVVVGFITNADGRSDGFVGSDARGYQRLVAPGGEMPANSTFCEGINNFAQVSCEVSDSEGNTVGAFIGSPHEGEGDEDSSSHPASSRAIAGSFGAAEWTNKPSEELVIPTTRHRWPLP